VGRRIRREREVVPLGCRSKRVEHDARFNARNAPRRVDFEDRRHVLREVEDDGGVAALSGKRRASAARQQRSVVIPAQSNGGENVFLVARNHDADRNLPVIGPVGGIECAAARVKADLPTKVAAERSLERGRVKLRGMGRGWSDVLRHKTQYIFEDAGVGRKGIAPFVSCRPCA